MVKSKSYSHIEVLWDAEKRPFFLKIYALSVTVHQKPKVKDPLQMSSWPSVVKCTEDKASLEN